MTFEKKYLFVPPIPKQKKHLRNFFILFFCKEAYTLGGASVYAAKGLSDV
jgi:hypothetical protein